MSRSTSAPALYNQHSVGQRAYDDAFNASLQRGEGYWKAKAAGQAARNEAQKPISTLLANATAAGALACLAFA